MNHKNNDKKKKDVASKKVYKNIVRARLVLNQQLSLGKPVNHSTTTSGV